MKKFILYFLLIAVSTGFAQTNPEMPTDPKVRIGHLPNGLTYYIRHNEEPKQRADFYLAQKVGSILEDENQRGLAHFLEHMCFNGTQNFPGRSLIGELEKKGIGFGSNINAYTGIDETVYNLSNIPVIRESLVDTALLVLHDWSGYLLLDEQEIDQERAVIHEEWRTQNSGSSRALEKYLGQVFAGTPYANRMPIGLMEVVDHFPYQALRDYYRKWYRPDLQGIFVVGDVDVDRMEAKIQALFGAIPAPVNPAPRPRFQVPDNNRPVVSVVSDPEIPWTSVYLYWKYEAVPGETKKTVDYYKNQLMDQLARSMFDYRALEISRKANPPFANASGNLGDFLITPVKRAWTVSGASNKNDGLTILEALLAENERMNRYGFTSTELERAKSNLLRSFEKEYTDRARITNRTLTREYIRNFLQNEPIPGIEWEYQAARLLLEGLSVEELNRRVQTYGADHNPVVVITGPEKKGVALPSEEQVLAALGNIKRIPLDPHTDTVAGKPLLAQIPRPGKVVKTTKGPLGYTCWKLSNGAKVYVKNTGYQEDELILYAHSPGGYSLAGDGDLPSAMVADGLVADGGVGGLNTTELEKALTGKRAHVSFWVSQFNEWISGDCSLKDAGLMMQLTWLRFTSPRRDTVAFENWKTSVRNWSANRKSIPGEAFNDTVDALKANHHPRYLSLYDPEVQNRIGYDKALDIYRQRFANAADFTFFLTGNLPVDSLKPLVETYLGSLPSVRQKERFRDHRMYPPSGYVKKHFERDMQTPKSMVETSYTGKIRNSLKNWVLMDYLKGILRLVYTETIREKEGGSYVINVSGSTFNVPRDRFSLWIRFNTGPAQVDTLLTQVYSEIDKLTANGPEPEKLDKVRENMLKNYREGLSSPNSSYWSSLISTLFVYGIDMRTHYEQTVKAVSPEQVRRFARKVFGQGNCLEVVMNPAGQTKTAGMEPEALPVIKLR